MKHAKKLFTTAALPAVIGSLQCGTSTFASEALWSTYTEAGRKLVKERNYPQAEKQLEMALQNAGDLPPTSDKLADLYDLLGQVYCKTGKLSKAEEVLKRSLETREKNPKREELKLFATLLFLGTVYRNENKFSDSEALYKRGLSMFEGKGPIKNLCQCTVLTALGSLYAECDRPAEAETLLRKAIELRNSSLFKSAVAAQTIYDTLGRVLQMQGKFDEAAKQHELAIDAATKNKDPVGRAFAQANLANVRAGQGQYEKSRQLLDDARKVVESTSGADSVEAATIYSNLALVAINQDRYTEAEEYLKRANEIHERHLGPNHTNVAYDQGKMVDIYRNQGKYAEAAAAGQRAVQIFTDTLGRNTKSTAQALSILAGVYRDQQQYDKAVPLLNQAVECANKALGEGNRDSALYTCTLGQIASARGNYEEAKMLLEQALEVLSKDKNTEPLTLAFVCSELASLDKREGKLGEAESLIKKSLASREIVYGAVHPKLLGDLRLLSKVLGEENKSSDLAAVKCRIELIEQKYPDVAKMVAVAAPPLSSSKLEIAGSANLNRPVSDKWALVIGISNFAEPDLNLKYAAKDAIDFANFLKSNAHFAADHVKVLTDEEATRENIINQMGNAWLGRLAHPDDLVVIYISSHGSVARNEAGGVNFLAARDTRANALLSTGIPMQWLSQIIKEQVHSDRIVVVLDVCHSGAVSSGQKGLTRENTFDPGKIEVGAGQALICSSAPEQVSWESKNYSNSVFTRRLIEALQQSSGGVDLNKAYAYLREQVESEVLRDRGQLQTPLLFSKDWQGAPPILSVTPTKPRSAILTSAGH